MPDDYTPTNPEPVGTVGAQLDALKADPTQEDLYLELRDTLRDKGLKQRLAEVCEVRAPHEPTPARCAQVWTEAGEARLMVGQAEAAERDLREALVLDAANERAAALLTEYLLGHDRHAEAAAVIELELEELSGSGNGESGEAFATRRAQRHQLVATLWQDKLGRLDRALVHYQRAWQLEPHKTEALEAARKIYLSLGDDGMVTQLYEAELEVLPESGADARRAHVELALGRLKTKLGDSEDAAAHLEKALELSPDSEDVREALAEVYASPAFAGESTRQQRAGELFVQLGTTRLETQDEEQAISYLRRALGVDPYSRIGSDSLENALVAALRWDELDRLYRHRLSIAENDDDRAALLTKRAELYKTNLPDPEALKRTLELLAGIYGPLSAHAYELRELYIRDEDWDHLAALLIVEIDALESDPHQMISELLYLATIEREHLGDKDKAAEHLHRVLTIDSQNQEAISRYGDHFRERRDWRGLADLTEFSIDNLRDAGGAPHEVARGLEELAQIAEVRLGDVERAIATWKKIEELEPANRKAKEALRRLMSKAKMWESLVGHLQQEAEQAETPEARAEALRRMAQVYRERQFNPRRAISLYEEVLGLFPDDEATIKALMEMYEREGDDAGAATTIRRQLDLDVRNMLAEQEISGSRSSTAREWPVGKRVERLTSLRRLAGMYENRLADVEGVVFACSGVLEILPGDRDALERMERVLEKAGDLQRLEQTLEYHAAAATGPAEKAKVLRRLSRLADDRDDEVLAMERWELVIKAAPNDADALEALSALYERHGRWTDLAQVLERTLMGQKPPEPGSPDAAKRAAELKRYARVVDSELGDAGRAMRVWQKVIDLLPRDRDALESLARLYRQHGQWRELSGILERQAPLYLNDDPARAVTIALTRAKLLEERLGAPAEATQALESLIGELDPSNVEAHKTLRRLYESRGDFEAAVRVAEREFYLTKENDQKIARALEIGLLCRDRLSDPTRALQALGRVLELDKNNEQALKPAAELYAQVGKWREHVQMLERQVERTEDSRSKRTLMLQIAQATAERLNDHEAAFQWYRQAHHHAPDATTIAELRRAAEAYGLWRELAEVYEDERGKFKPSDKPLPGMAPAAGELDEHAFVAACRELAAIAEHRLGDSSRAMDAIYDALAVQPDGEDLLSEAERIAQEADDRAIWYRLLECMELPIHVADRAGRVALHQRRGRIREERLEDNEGAVEELLKAFSWAPERDENRRALYDLAERIGTWSNVVAIEAALFERAPTVKERIEIQRRRAQVIEEKIEDRVRAYRAYISAFLIDPEDAETLSHIWRLARDIGSYRDSEKTPQPEPPAAYVEPTNRPTGKPKQDPLVIESSKPVREATQELSMTDLIDARTGELDIEKPARRDQTQELDIADLMDVRAAGKARQDPTMELRTQDLIDVLRTEAGDTEAPTAPEQPRTRSKGPPPPPPKAPRIKRTARSSQVAAKRPQTPAAAGERPRPAPTLPVRAYSSPWSELAAAYQALPAPNLAARLRWQFRAAEVWETGAKDVQRAFDTLAKAVDMAPNEAEPRDRLHRLAKDHNEWDRLAELYEHAAEDAASSESAAQLLMEVAEVRSLQGRPRETESLYRRVLGMRPDDVPAREKLEALYRGESRWVDLAASLEERTDPRLGAAAPEAQRPALLRELAGIYSEKLTRPRDAIDALDRLRELMPDDVEVLDQLAAMYGEIGRWSQVVDTLNKVGDVAEGSDHARRALRHIGRIYEVELELPDRAVDAYVQLVAQWPNDVEAYEALDRLYKQQAKWTQLDDTLRRRAALAKTPEERAELLGRRASVLMEWLDAPEDAAAALRHARTINPEDPTLAEQLVEALARAGREREAAAVLEGRIAAMKDAKASEGDVAALLIKLAALRAERLRDVEGARQVLEEALALVPDHPTALSTLATLAEVQKDPRAYAEAKLREADAQTDVDAKLEALMNAGTTLRDQCSDIDGARGAFERVLQLRPYHADATWALAGLVEQGGDPEAASKVLQARLEAASLEPQERAQVLTQLAALARQAGIDVQAQRRLNEALEVVPDHLPAIIAQADLLDELGQFDDLQAFLLDIIAKLEQKPAEARAELHRRLALAYESVKRDDDAYQTLLEADRLHRRNLLVKLALGENRYRARRWREAALHLGSLATHDEAERHPAEVAEGLYHAALAEIRSLRPEKAEPLYERAIELKPNYTPALHALAELAMEKGDMKRAADLLTRQAMATEQPDERLRLFEALGDMALMTLGDEERAKVCFEAAVNAASPLESRHLPLLRKLLERQDLAGDHLGAARSAELMASFAANASARTARLKAAAENYLAAGQKDKALAAADRAVQSDPYDLLAVTIASELLMKDGEFEQTAAMLGRALSKKQTEAPDDVTAARQSLLWSRLGEARLERGDEKGATGALENAVAKASDSDGAMAARRRLLRLWKNNESKRDTLLSFRRELAADTLALEDVSGYAHALRERGQVDGCRAVLDLAGGLGYEYSDVDVGFLGKHPAKTMAEDEAYKGAINADDRAELIADDADRPMSALLSAIWDAAALLWSDAKQSLDGLGLGSAQRISATSDVSAAAVFTRIARALDAPATVLYATSTTGAPDVSVVCVSPPIVVLGPRPQGLGGESLSDLELRFELARAAELARPERIIATGLPQGELEKLIESLVRVFGDAAVESNEEDDKLRKTLPVKVRSRLEKLLKSRPRLAIGRYLTACQRAADRAGLLICGDYGTARRLTSQRGDGSTRHLEALVLERGYLGARAKLGLG